MAKRKMTKVQTSSNTNPIKNRGRTHVLYLFDRFWRYIDFNASAKNQRHL